VRVVRSGAVSRLEIDDRAQSGSVATYEYRDQQRLTGERFGNAAKPPHLLVVTTVRPDLIRGETRPLRDGRDREQRRPLAR
jgi:hypothetical protein